ncbi:MAG: hypothetical protein RLW62_05080, partial [Gammaproteobacteria bacterium]
MSLPSSAPPPDPADVLDCRHDGAITWLRLNAPNSGNRLSRTLVDALHAALDDVLARDETRVLVLAAH